jgi:Pyruvate/2-oxoacid:ferredoxin oxidoreductase delta subunit
MSDRAYLRIAENVDKGFQTAPKADGELSEAFIAYLRLVYAPEEAELVQHLEMETFGNPQTAQQVADASGQDAAAVDEALSALAKKGFLNDTERGYALPIIQNLVNLHMLYPEIKPDDLKAAELYQQFFIKDRFYKFYATSGKGTPVSRSIPVEHAIHPDEKTFSGEEAHAHIKGLDTDDLALVPCPCRTRTEKMGIRECKDQLPVASCIFIGKIATHFEKLGLGKRVTKQQALAYLDEAAELGLIPTANNYLADPHFIMCLCCGCCCSNVRGRTRWDNPTAVLPSQFVPEATDDCIQCETCIDRCFLGALSMDEEAEHPVVDTDKCIGCGVCTITCQTDSLKLHRFERPGKPFETGVEFVMTVAKDNERL